MMKAVLEGILITVKNEGGTFPCKVGKKLRNHTAQQPGKARFLNANMALQLLKSFNFSVITFRTGLEA